MTGDRVWIEVLMAWHHSMLRDSEELRARLFTGHATPEFAYSMTLEIARRGRWLDRQLDDIERKHQTRYISALENVMRKQESTPNPEILRLRRELQKIASRESSAGAREIAQEALRGIS